MKDWAPIFIGGIMAVSAIAAEIDPSKLPPPVTPPGRFCKRCSADFRRKVVTVATARKRQEAGLRFDIKADALKGSENGPGLFPVRARESLVIHAVSRLGDLKMPKKGRTSSSSEQVGTICAARIDQGRNGLKRPWLTRRGITGRSVRRVRPAVPKEGTPANPIDSFVLARLELEKLKPSPEADKAPCCDGLSLDLIGLPPTPEEVDAFVADNGKG